MSKKEAYEQKIEARLDEWKAEINQLKAKAQKAEADAQIRYYKQIEDIQAKQEAARKKLRALKNAGEDAWKDLKTGLDDALNRLGDAIKSATSHF